jgi:hypothetical protein
MDGSNMFDSIAPPEQAVTEPTAKTDAGTPSAAPSTMFDSLLPEEPEAEEEIAEEDAEPEVKAEAGLSEEDVRLQKILDQIAKETKKAPIPGYQMAPIEYYKQKYGDRLEDTQIQAMFDMQNEIAFQNINAYHQSEVIPHIARLAQDSETQKEIMAVTQMAGKQQYSDIVNLMPEMNRIIADDPDLQRMPTEKRIKMAYLQARDENLPNLLKKAEQQGRNNEQRDMAKNLRTPAATGGRSPQRDGRSPMGADEIRFAKMMGNNPQEIARIKGGR